MGFAIRTNLVNQLNCQPVNISDRLMTLRIPLSDQSYATIISAYAPTMTNNDENKERFYEQLDDAVRKVSVRDKLVILG